MMNIDPAELAVEHEAIQSIAVLEVSKYWSLAKTPISRDTAPEIFIELQTLAINASTSRLRELAHKAMERVIEAVPDAEARWYAESN